MISYTIAMEGWTLNIVMQTRNYRTIKLIIIYQRKFSNDLRQFSLVDPLPEDKLAEVVFLFFGDVRRREVVELDEGVHPLPQVVEILLVEGEDDVDVVVDGRWWRPESIITVLKFPDGRRNLFC